MALVRDLLSASMVQEAGLTSECETVCDDGQFSWTDLMWVTRWLQGRGVDIASVPSSHYALRIHSDAYWDQDNDVAQVFYYESS